MGKLELLGDMLVVVLRARVELRGVTVHNSLKLQSDIKHKIVKRLNQVEFRITYTPVGSSLESQERRTSARL